MKRKIVHGFAVAALLIGSVQSSRAQVVYVENTYDDTTSVNGDWQWWGVATFNWDGSQDHTGNGGGAIYISAPYVQNLGSPTYNNQISIGEVLSHVGPYDGSVTVDGTLYTNLSMWVKLDTNNSTLPLSVWNTDGDNGLKINYTGSGVNNGTANGWQNNELNIAQFPDAVSNGWVKLNYPINATLQQLSLMQGITFNKYDSDTLQTGTFAFWVDDIQFEGAGKPPPPPTLSAPTKPVTGLSLIAASGPYNREAIQTVLPQSWIGMGSTPVTYSYTVKQGVDGTGGAQFQNHIMLVPSPGTETSPDWNEPNVVFLDMESQADGTALWTFRYKTNEPNGNTMIYNGGVVSGVTVTAGGSGYTNAPTVVFTGGGGSGATATAEIDGSGAVTNVVVNNGGSLYVTPPDVSFTDGGGSGATATASTPGAIGALGSITNATPVGTWTVTFLNDTNITMTTPSGASTNFSIPEESAQLFADPLSAYFGVQANNSTAVGMDSVLSEVKITGTFNPIDDVFANDSALDANTWNIVAADPKGIIQIPSTAVYWLNWTVPDAGYSLITSSNISNTEWSDLPGVTPFQLSGKKWVLLSASDLPSAQAGFFKLVKRQFSQLQVLFPGETNAPNTPTGKIGTPNPVTAGDTSNPVNMTVNAVDSSFHIVSGVGDTIDITTPDDPNSLIQNAAALSNGTGVYQVIFGTSGSQTVVATDTSNTNIPPATSSPVTVQ